MDRADFLAKEVTGLSFEDIPSCVVFKAKTLLLDQQGCQLAFSVLPWSEAMYRYAQIKRGQGVSTIVYCRTKLDAEDAASVMRFLDMVSRWMMLICLRRVIRLCVLFSLFMPCRAGR